MQSAADEHGQPAVPQSEAAFNSSRLSPSAENSSVGPGLSEDNKPVRDRRLEGEAEKTLDGTQAPVNDQSPRSIERMDALGNETKAEQVNQTEGATEAEVGTPSIPSLKLKISAPPTQQAPVQSQSQATAPATEQARVYSLRRSERLRNQALKAEEARRIKEERQAIEEARARARSIAAKKAAATKKKAAKKAAELKLAEERGIVPKNGTVAGSAATGATGGSSTRSGSAQASSRKPPRRIVKLHYFNAAVPPTFRRLNLSDDSPVDATTPAENTPIEGTSVALFWLRANLREFLFRFDKLCRLSSRFTGGLNDPLVSWTPEQFKSAIISLLKLIANDTKPLHDRVRDYIAEIDVLEPSNPRIWDWLLDFVEQLDPHAPEEVPTTEVEQLELLRRLVVLCTGTETVRITVMTDVDQLKWVEKDTHEEIKGIWAKYKETEQRLAKLKQNDKETYNDRLAAAHRAASNKVWRAQQQLFMKTHKYNMRTAPLLEDPQGNRYWSLQFKSTSQPDWGSWIICEMRVPPLKLAAWYQQLGTDVTSVLRKRDQMITEKNQERRKQRKVSKTTDTAAPAFTELVPTESVSSTVDVADTTTATNAATTTTVAPTAPGASINKQPKRRYPKLKITPPVKLEKPELYVVEGRQNILQLAKWISGFSGVDKKAVAEIESVATFFAQDDE